jgi:hypothetical protein
VLVLPAAQNVIVNISFGVFNILLTLPLSCFPFAKTHYLRKKQTRKKRLFLLAENRFNI